MSNKNCKCKKNICTCKEVPDTCCLQSLVVTDGTNSQELQNCDSLLFRSTNPLNVEIQSPNTVHVSIEEGAPGDVLTTNASGTVVWAQPGQNNRSILTNNSDGTYTHDDGFGNTTLIDTRAISNPFDPAGSGLTSTNVNSAIIEVYNELHEPATVASSDLTVIATASGADNQDFDFRVNIPGIISAKPGNGLIVGPDGKLCAPDGSGNTSTITYNNDGTYTHNDGTGVLEVIDANYISSCSLTGTNLTFTRRDGTTKSINLSSLLDNTNLARIVSGVLTGNVIRLTRDDGTFIDIDLTSILSQLHVPAVINSADGTVNIVTTGVDNQTFDLSVNETLTTLQLVGGDLVFTGENGVPVTITLPSGAVGTVSSLIQQNASGNVIATHSDGNGNNVDILETITSLSLIGSTLTFTDENGTPNQIDLSTLIPAHTPSSFTNTLPTGNLIGVHNDGYGASTNIFETATTITYDPVNFVLTYLSETGTQTINLSGLAGGGTGSISNVTNTIAGNPIATHDNGNGGTIVINESITSLTLVGNDLQFVDETGTTTTITLPSGSTGATMTEASCQLTFDDGNGNTLVFPVFRNVSTTLPATVTQPYTETRVKEVAIRHDASDCSLKGYVEKEFKSIGTNIDLGTLEQGRVYPTQGNLTGTIATNYHKVQLLPPYTRTEIWGVKAHILEDNAGRTVPVILEVYVNGVLQPGITATFGTGVDQQTLLLGTPIVINDLDEISIIASSAPGNGAVGYGEIKIQHQILNVDII